MIALKPEIGIEFFTGKIGKYKGVFMQNRCRQIIHLETGLIFDREPETENKRMIDTGEQITFFLKGKKVK